MLGYLRQNVKEYLRANIAVYFFLVLVFLSGIVVGALAAKSLPYEQKIELAGYLKVFFQGLAESPRAQAASGTELLSAAMLNNTKSIFLMWLLGFTVIGLPFVLFIVFTRGFVVGFTVGFLVNEYIVKGLVFAFAAVLPHNLFAVPAVLITGVSATSFSLLLVRRKQRLRVNLLLEAAGYSALCVAMLLLMAAAAFVEVYISPVFMRLVAGILLRV